MAKNASSNVPSDLLNRLRRERPEYKTGVARTLAKVNSMGKRSWDQLSEQMTHVTDFEGRLQQFQITPQACVLTIALPLVYDHEIIDLHKMGKLSMLFFRAYVAPLPEWMQDEIDDDTAKHLVGGVIRAPQD